MRDAILATSDQLAAVGMMLQTSYVPNPGLILEHAQPRARWPHSPRLLWEKHAVATGDRRRPGSLFALLCERLLLGTRPKIDPAAARLRPARGARYAAGHHRTVEDRADRQGDIVYACAISGANILRDMREAVVNTIGGHMTKYEALLDTDDCARPGDVSPSAPARKATTGCVGLRISHPFITSGAIEVVVAGTGFRYASRS